MHRPVMSLAVVAAAVVTVSPVFASSLTERFSAASSQQSITSLAPAPRVKPSRSIEGGALLPTAAADDLRPALASAVDLNRSLGKITSSSVSKLVLNGDNGKSTETLVKSGETNPLLEALRWKGANAAQVGVPAELWCADFMNFILRQTGEKGTGSRAARSFLKYGKPLDGPRVGAIVVFTRGKSELTGHVGIVRGTDGDGNPIVISGNHGKKVAESVYPKHRVLGYFMPPSMEQASAATMSAAVNSVIAANR
ncbi:MAG TPA: TIGR02594 family protein [Xanthobacteraceae bacterium]|nr:TIGR02594 family protein [Xanthobacteraceae bacterium]